MRLLSLLCCCFSLLLPNLLPAQTLEIQIEDNNVSGGGFQSDVAISNDGLTVYSAADVSGIFKSTDGGLRFKSVNEGLMSQKVASIVITPDNDQLAMEKKRNLQAITPLMAIQCPIHTPGLMVILSS